MTRKLAHAGRLGAPKTMNRTEAAWAQELAKMQAAGELRWWGYEQIKLELGHAAWFTPDFAVIWADGELSFDEVKGFWREAARVRIKVAATRYPYFRFRVIERGEGGRADPAWKIAGVDP